MAGNSRDSYLSARMPSAGTVAREFSQQDKCGASQIVDIEYSNITRTIEATQ